ncbi:RND superfamily putative drug exporter [Streptomyces sp. SAI-144]|uniref:MMPL family transporter n=1 Tax=unclassified Streptomyces TaxID=2593676 RepID=UPI00247638C0|nr:MULTISPECIES: MMPL family transporter [unclassified Streptomyces]MDH6431637.1 RND superfamily putative drug exporter [Streptomyces sp. SAI-144]MDH6493005.1 RND superfamily putative drug exporter [Streptomyces sp. SAI-127]
MATFLYRIGRWAFRRRRLVGGLWLSALLLAVAAAAMAPAGEEEDLSMPGTESQKAFDLLDERFPQSNSQGAEARLVFRAPDGQRVTAGENKAAVEDALGSLDGGGQVASTTDPYTTGAVSEDGTIAYSTITYTADAVDLTGSTKSALEDAASQARDAGLTVEIGGSALDAEEELGGTTELIGVAVAAVVLVLALGSLVAAGLSLLTAFTGVAIAFGLVSALAVPLGLTSTVAILALMLGLAVGIDYALFITSRFRDERAQGSEPEEAAGRAVGTAGSAVVFAGATVIIALAGLGVVGIPELTKMGMGGAGAVALAVLVALTLVPALFGFFGRRVLSRRIRKATSPGSERPQRVPAAADRPGLGTRWARFVLRRPVAVLMISGLGLGAVALPALSLELGLPGDESKSVETTQRRAYDLLSEGFGPGFNGPLTVVVDMSASEDTRATTDLVVKTVGGVDGVASVGDPVLSRTKDTAVITAVPRTAPNSGETKDLVHAIRDAVPGVEADTGAAVLVTGTTAMNIDISEAMSDALVPYLTVVIGLAVLLLTVVFRSLLVPVKAALGFLLSVGAAFGVLVAVFQWGWAADLLGIEQTGPVMSLMPILIIGIVFGLAMDYEVFLLTRMREAYVHGASPGEAIVSGFRHSGRVVAAAAIIMISVFAGFVGMTSPTIQTMGVGLAAAVAFDAFVVRMAIAPAVLALLGHRAWWLPRILNRVLPNVDIEGEALSRHVPAATAEPDAAVRRLPVGRD